MEHTCIIILFYVHFAVVRTALICNHSHDASLHPEEEFESAYQPTPILLDETVGADRSLVIYAFQFLLTH